MAADNDFSALIAVLGGLAGLGALLLAAYDRAARIRSEANQSVEIRAPEPKSLMVRALNRAPGKRMFLEVRSARPGWNVLDARRIREGRIEPTSGFCRIEMTQDGTDTHHRTVFYLEPAPRALFVWPVGRAKVRIRHEGELFPWFERTIWVGRLGKPWRLSSLWSSPS